MIVLQNHMVAILELNRIAVAKWCPRETSVGCRPDVKTSCTVITSCPTSDIRRASYAAFQQLNLHVPKAIRWSSCRSNIYRTDCTSRHLERIRVVPAIRANLPESGNWQHDGAFYHEGTVHCWLDEAFEVSRQCAGSREWDDVCHTNTRSSLGAVLRMMLQRYWFSRKSV